MSKPEVSANTQRLIDLLRQRDAVGLKKYGVSLDRTDLTQSQWIQHAIEELLDGAAYLEGLKKTLTAEPAGEGEGEKIDWERLREWAADPRKKIPELAFTSGPERTIADLICSMLVASEPSPEVIEGKGQVVTQSEAGMYLRESRYGGVDRSDLVAGNSFLPDHRYMRCPTFPPRPAFVAPEKPEPKYHLYRITQGASKGNTFWGLPASNGAELFICNEPDYFNSEWCEEINPLTGEPLAIERG